MPRFPEIPEIPEIKAQNDAYRAIGRYVVEFSRLVFTMRQLLAQRLSESEQDTTLAELALGQVAATQLADAFFAVCLADGDLDDEETKIGRSLRARVLKEASDNRNDLAHGDWWVTGWVENEDFPPAMLVRIKPAKSKETRTTHKLTVEDIDKWSDHVWHLTLLVGAFGSNVFGYSTPKKRVREVLELKDGRVVYRGTDHPPPPPPSSSDKTDSQISRSSSICSRSTNTS